LRPSCPVNASCLKVFFPTRNTSRTSHSIPVWAWKNQPCDFLGAAISTTVRSLWSYKIHAALRRESPYAAFYRENHPSQALEISRRILLMFAQEARRRGKQPLIVFFPSEDDLVASQKGAPWLYQPLLDDLRRAGQPYLNLGTNLVARLNGRHPRALFGIVHFKEEGNFAIAEAVHQALVPFGTPR